MTMVNDQVFQYCPVCVEPLDGVTTTVQCVQLYDHVQYEVSLDDEFDPFVKVWPNIIDDTRLYVQEQEDQYSL